MHHDEDLHVAFAAPDVAPEARPVQSYGSSISLRKALSGEVLLAWEMNGQPLPRVHGGPVRVVVPGYIGARSVKWVTSMTVQAFPSQNYFQALDYRILPPEADADTVAPGEGIPLSSLPLNCDILTPTDGDRAAAGRLTIRGWALAGDGHDVARVDVSVDQGRTWRQAKLEQPPSRWAWRMWSLRNRTADRDGPGLGRHRRRSTRIHRVPVESARIRQQRICPHRIDGHVTESRRCPQNASRFQRYPIFAAAIVVAGVISGLAFSVLYDNSALVLCL